jgi:hypothetical protein
MYRNCAARDELEPSCRCVIVVLVLLLAASLQTDARQMIGAARRLKQKTIPGLPGFPPITIPSLPSPSPTSPVATDQNPNSSPAIVSCQSTSKSTAFSEGQSALAQASACLQPVASIGVTGRGMHICTWSSIPIQPHLRRPILAASADRAASVPASDCRS